MVNLESYYAEAEQRLDQHEVKVPVLILHHVFVVAVQTHHRQLLLRPELHSVLLDFSQFLLNNIDLIKARRHVLFAKYLLVISRRSDRFILDNAVAFIILTVGNLFLLLLVGVEGQGDRQVLTRLHVGKDECVLAWYSCVKEDDALCAAFTFINDVTIGIIHNAADRLVNAATENVVCTFDLGRLDMIDDLHEGLCTLPFYESIDHILRNEVVHVLSPYLVYFFISHVAVKVLFLGVRFLNQLIVQNLLRILRAHHLVTIPAPHLVHLGAVAFGTLSIPMTVFLVTSVLALHFFTSASAWLPCRIFFTPQPCECILTQHYDSSDTR